MKQRKYKLPPSYAVLAAILASGIALSCNSPRRTVKKLAHIQAIHPALMASACATYYPSTDSVSERIVYKQGTPIDHAVLKYVTVNCDSITRHAATTVNTKRLVVPCPPCDSIRIDTIDRNRYERGIDRALQAKQSGIIAGNERKIAAQQNSIKWWMWIAIAFGSYSILRWVLRIWSIKLL